MQVFASLFWLFLLFLSNLGYWEFIRRRTGIHKYFSPSLTVVFQITVMFFAGLLNCMVAVSNILWAVGILLLLVNLKSLFKGCYKEYLSPGYIYLIGMTCVALAALRGQVFTHYDNFSHWALVVKVMLVNDRMPNFQDTIISFQEYPLGSSVYIYYFAKAVSHAESIQMLAQAFVMLCMIMPIFVYLKKHQVLGFILTVLLTNFIFTFNIGINNLLVDTLLPLVGAAAWMLWQNRDDRNIRPYLLGVSLYLTATVQIKNSGILFAGLGTIFLLVYIVKTRKNVLAVLAAIIFPFITLYFWNRHCAYVFSDAETSKHAMTATNYSSVFADKTAEEIRTIVTGMIKFSVTGIDFYLFIAALIVTLTVTFIFSRNLFPESLKLVISLLIIYGLYSVSMLLMYLLSMPGAEATGLASAGRYRKTIFIVAYMLLFAFLMKLLSAIVIRWKALACFAVIAALLIGTWRMDTDGFPTLLSKADASEREWFEKQISVYGVPQGSSFAVAVLPEEYSGYAAFILRYILMSTDEITIVATEPSQMNNIGNRQYLFVYDQSNQIVNDWIKANYPDQLGNNVIVLRDRG